MAFFGQFIAHDITADRSPLGHRADPAQVRNFRVPGQSRNQEGVALIGDPRNDVHLFISQMSGVIKLHNRLVDRLRTTTSPSRTSSRRRDELPAGTTST